jgi:hypothetical protein
MRRTELEDELQPGVVAAFAEPERELEAEQPPPDASKRRVASAAARSAYVRLAPPAVAGGQDALV